LQPLRKQLAGIVNKQITAKAGFLSRTGKVKVWARIKFDFDAHSTARMMAKVKVWARIRINSDLKTGLCSVGIWTWGGLFIWLLAKIDHSIDISPLILLSGLITEQS
jgi:hypothetical protein